jgi:hypothetical protein
VKSRGACMGAVGGCSRRNHLDQVDAARVRVSEEQATRHKFWFRINAIMESHGERRLGARRRGSEETSRIGQWHTRAQQETKRIVYSGHQRPI